MWLKRFRLHLYKKKCNIIASCNVPSKIKLVCSISQKYVRYKQTAHSRRQPSKKTNISFLLTSQYFILKHQLFIIRLHNRVVRIQQHSPPPLFTLKHICDMNCQQSITKSIFYLEINIQSVCIVWK